MYKLLLVDDEEFVLNGLQKLIRSLIESNNISVSEIKTAQNGLEAIEIMEHYAADIILTDIKMPGMNGIEFIERLSAKNSNCKIIILSGYSNFEYAQKAIANNIRAYLLKPVKRVDLENALLKVFAELTEESGKFEYIQKLEGQLASDIPLLREKFFYELSNGNYQKELAQFLQLDLDTGLYQIILITPDSFKTNDFSQISLEKEKQLKLLQLSNQLYEHLSDIIPCITFQLHHRICSLLSLNEQQNNIFLERCLKSYQGKVHQNSGIVCSIGVSRSFHHITDFSIHLEEAFAALKQRRLFEQQSLVFFTDVFSWQKYDESALLYETNNKVKYEIYYALRAGQHDKAFDILHNYQKTFSNIHYCSLERIRTICSDFITVFMMFSFEQNIDTKQLLYGNISPGEAIFLANNLDDIFSILNHTATKIFQCLSEKSQAETVSIIRRIKTYIWNHLSEDITLETLSDIIFLTPNYISTLFKRETGVSFKDYVLEIKIQKAKELLQCNELKIHEIAEAVGYHSAPYFSKIFKRVTGVYPSEYRSESTTQSHHK